MNSEFGMSMELYYGGTRCRHAINTKLHFTHNVISSVKFGKYTASAASKINIYFWTVELTKAHLKQEIILVITTNLHRLFKTMCGNRKCTVKSYKINKI